MSTSKTQYEHIIPELKEWPISKFSEGRDAFIERLIDFVLDKILSSPISHLEILNKTVYLEQKRVRLNPWKVDPSGENEYWSTIAKEIQQTKKADNPDKEQIKILRRIVHRYSEEIIGHFVPKTFLLARKVLTFVFKRLFNNGLGRKHSGIWGRREELLDKIKVDGQLESVRKLFSKGTVVIVPTHYTNLDSILIGYAIDGVMSIPAFAYGAGLNLYDMELFAYYMNRLGAYRVDRRKKNPIYLETLKGMASLSLIEGLNHIFFPGGTRSRSGAIEEKLKLGLLNSVIDAQRHCLVNDLNQKIFIVPLTLGYHFVIEAGSLIEQNLRLEGKESYTKVRRKKSALKSAWTYITKLRRKDSEVYLTLGHPMDVLGNKVDEHGQSYDQRGGELELSSYFMTKGKQTYDAQRESIYTKILAERIIKSFKKDNKVLSSHLVAYAAFNILMSRHKSDNKFEIFSSTGTDLKIHRNTMINTIESYQNQLKGLEAKGSANLSDVIKTTADECLEDGIKHIGIYHKNAVLTIDKNNNITTHDLRLLYYYHNKMIHYELRKPEMHLT